MISNSSENFRNRIRLKSTLTAFEKQFLIAKRRVLLPYDPTTTFESTFNLDFQSTFATKWLPIMMRYMIKQPRLVIKIQICTASDPNRPNDSLITPAYVVDRPECVNLNRNSTDTSTSKAIITMSANAGTTPSTLTVTGIDMIPAPMMLVDTLNTAPGTEPPLVIWLSDGKFSSGRSGSCTLESFLAGDMSAVEYRDAAGGGVVLLPIIEYKCTTCVTCSF